MVDDFLIEADRVSLLARRHGFWVSVDRFSDRFPIGEGLSLWCGGIEIFHFRDIDEFVDAVESFFNEWFYQSRGDN